MTELIEAQQWMVTDASVVAIVFPFGTSEQVRDEARALFRTMKPGVGLIVCTSHKIQADTPVEYVLALIEAYHDFGE